MDPSLYETLYEDTVRDRCTQIRIDEKITNTKIEVDESKQSNNLEETARIDTAGCDARDALS